MSATLTGAVRPAPTRRSGRAYLRVGLAIVGLLLAAWVALGVLRAESVARAYFAAAHGGGATLANVTIEGSGPAIPPFWSVRISGDVVETGQTTPVYRSHLILWVEPLSGWALVNAGG
jgi:hypothetical protein